LCQQEQYSWNPIFLKNMRNKEIQIAEFFCGLENISRGVSLQASPENLFVGTGGVVCP